MYGEKLLIDLQRVTRSNLGAEVRRPFKVDLWASMNGISSLIRNNVYNLMGVSFEEFLEIVKNQSIPLQAIFVAGHFNGLGLNFTSRSQGELDAEIGQLVARYRSRE